MGAVVDDAAGAAADREQGEGPVRTVGTGEFDDLLAGQGRGERSVARHSAVVAGLLGQLRIQAVLLGLGLTRVGKLATAGDGVGVDAIDGLGRRPTRSLL